MNWNDYRKKVNQNDDYRKVMKELEPIFAFGDAIIKKRIEKGWSQTELARRVGTRQANISRIEAGLANPTLRLIQEISNILDIEIQFKPTNEEENVDHQKFIFFEYNSQKIKKEIRIEFQYPKNLAANKVWIDNFYNFIEIHTSQNVTTEAPILIENWPTRRDNAEKTEKNKEKEEGERHD